MVSYLVNYLRIYYDGIEDQKIRNKFAHLMTLKKDRESALLIEGNSTDLKSNSEGALVNFLVQTMPDFV